MLLILSGIFVLSFLIAIVATPVILSLTKRFNFMDQPSERKIHPAPVPYGGGISIFLAVIGSVGLGLLGAWIQQNYQIIALPEHIEQYIPGVLNKSFDLMTIFILSTVILILGLLDDKFKLPIAPKLIIEFTAALIFTIKVHRLDLFLQDESLNNLTGTIISACWIVLVTNIFNLLDHMDGVSSGTCVVCAIAFLVTAFMTGQLFISALLIALIGACLGFLIYNFPPAKIFLGDAGSLLIGFMLAIITVLFKFYSKPYPLYSYFVPMVVLSVPLFDTARVVLIRIRNKTSIFKADKNHFAHRLINLGLSVRASTLCIYVLTFVTGISSVLLYQVDLVGAFAILTQIILVFLIITILESYRLRNDKR